MNERFLFDERYLNSFDYVIGTDEAGRGPGAGDVFAAAVCFSSINDETKKLLENLNDSKQLTEAERGNLFEIITKYAVWTVYQGSVEDIEKINILNTSLLTMKNCVIEISEKLKSENIIVLIDGNKKIPGLNLKQETIVKGDFKSASIAAASIIAKVCRDRYMNELHKEFPVYGWSENKGYMTKQHLDAVNKYGLTKYHRRKFFEKFLDKSDQLTLF